MAKCTKCGATVADDSRFCNYCGAWLNAIGEHLDTKTLGSTESIMSALSKSAPRAVDEYVPLGIAVDGPLANGLFLAPPIPLEGPRAAGTSIWWSDGERLTEVASRFLEDYFERGALEINRDLVDTCKHCLTRYHRSRRIYTAGGLSDLIRNGGRPDLSTWARESTGGLDCPFCRSESLQPPEGQAFRRHVRSLKEQLEENHIRLAGLADEKELEADRLDEFRSGLELPDARRHRERVREVAATYRRRSEILAGLSNRVEQFVDIDVTPFRTFATKLPRLLLEPIESPAAWQEYQRPFLTCNDTNTTQVVDEWRGEIRYQTVTISPAMYADDEVGRLRTELAATP